MQATAWGVVAAGVVAPLLRRHIKAVPPLVTQTVAFAAPVGLSVALRPSPRRDVGICCLQMWAYVAAYKTPNDDEQAQAKRVRIDYPIDVDRVLGAGELPTVRLQRRLARRLDTEGEQWRTLDKVLVWTHWSWFMVPHGALAYILVRHPGRFPRAAVLTYAVFDVGAMVYWVLPTAPPWYATSVANRQVGHPAVRRMMVEYGESFWKDGWGPLYSVLGGNPLAAMPSLHFATSVMAALLLAEIGPLPGVLGTAYAATLGFALVYLGEHYVADLLAGAALTAAVRKLEPWVAPALSRVGSGLAALQEAAHA
jgi:membrane-associated phospholipid phosphatase